jgi:hypothetical protein
MATIYSSDLKLSIMATGENAGTWGSITNTNLYLLQQAIGGYEAISIAGGAQTTALTMSNGAISNARNAVIKLTGTITGNQIVTVPTGIEKTYIVSNGTVGAFTVQFIQAGGTGVTFATTDKSTKILFADGTNIVDTGTVSETGIQTLTNKTLTSPIINEIDDANSNEQIKFTATASAVNELTVTNAATGNAPEISSTGGDTNIDLKITPKGSGKVVLDGLKYPNSDGSNGQVLSTDGSGNLAFTTISSSPTSLKSNITLKTAASVTAGKLASINSSGEIVNLPTLNTYGTVRTNSSNTGGTAYTVTSLDGSTALSITLVTTSSNVSRATFYGSVISNSANPTNGTTTTNDVNIANGIRSSGVNAFPIGNNTFMVMQYGTGWTSGCCSNSTYFNSSYYIITVDASTGNVTKGAVTTSNAGPSGTGGDLQYWYAGQINKDILINYASHAQGALVKNLIITWTGTTVTITTDTTDVPFWFSANGTNSLLTSSNILCLGVPSSATWRTASWTASPPAIGTKTDTTAVADYYDSGAWWKMEDYSATGASYVLFTYRNTSLNYVYNTFSINQTTGALTSVETGTSLAKMGSTAFTLSTFKDSSNQVYSSGSQLNSVSWTNGVANGFNAAGYITVPSSPIRYNSGNLYYLFSSNTSNFPTNIGYTVNAYSTDLFNYIGVVETTTSSSPASIVTDGVAANFTSLTAGTVYYATTPYDGTVATSSASGILVGKAISSTQILLQRSNTQ